MHLLKLGLAASKLWTAESWGPAASALQGLLVCTCAYLVCVLSRLVSAHVAEAVLEEALRLASSPVEATALAALGLSLLVYSAGYSRMLNLAAAAQQFLGAAQLKLAILAYYSSSAAAQSCAGAAGASGGAAPPAAAPGGSSGSGSPKKDVASHRLTERGGRASKNRKRWSFDVAPSSGPRREVVPKQRTAPAGAAVRPAAAAPARPAEPAPAAAEPQQAQARQEPDAAGAAAPRAQPGRLRGGWQPAMERIASGQQLVELVNRRQSIENTRPPPAAAPAPSASQASARASDRVAATTPHPNNPLSAWASALQQHLPQLPAPPAAAPAPTPSASPSAQQPPLEQPGSQPDSPTKAALAGAGAWMASRTADLQSWASGTLESVLRPFAQGGRPGARGGLLRTQSAPAHSLDAELPLPAGEGLEAHGAGALAAEPRRRRTSSDGGSRAYVHGAVVAEPARQAKLEQYARAARLQARSAVSTRRGSLAAAATAPNPLTSFVSAALVPPLGGDAGRSAVASVGLDGDCPQEIRRLVTDEHLVQFGALLGEEASLKTSTDLGMPQPWGTEQSLYGALDSRAGTSDDWEQIVSEVKPGLRYTAWRRPLRGGLYMYRASAVLAGVSPREVRAFHMDDDIRPHWDETVLAIERVAPEGGAHLPPNSEWCLHRFRSRFPRPMAAREYSYARRVWHRPADGGCYMICRTAELPKGEGGSKAVHVSDYVSCAAIRAAEGGTELATAYFEDSHVRPGLAKMAVPKGLWPFIVKYEAALRSASLEAGPEAGRRTSLDGAAGGGGRAARRFAPGWAKLARSGRRGGGGEAAPRGEQHAPQPPAGKLFRTVVLATGVKVMYDLMVRR